MARDGRWVVWMGVWTSSAVLAPLGAFLTYKSNKDSVVLNAAAYINWFKKIVGIRHIRHLFKKEVVIHDPDYTRIPGDLQVLTDECKEYIAKRNPDAKVIPICAKTGEGMTEWTGWLKSQVTEWKMLS